MSGIDWMDTPLKEFYPRHEIGEDGRTTGQIVFPHGDGTAHAVLRSLQSKVERTYEELIALGDYDWLEKTGEVPVIRDTQRGYKLLDELTLRDLPSRAGYVRGARGGAREGEAGGGRAQECRA
jgi:hypothetical protein